MESLFNEVYRISFNIDSFLRNSFIVSILAVVDALKGLNDLLGLCRLCEHLVGVLIHRLHRTADIHDSKLLKLLQEALLLSAEENEGIFHHLSYHCSAPPLLL